VNTSFQFRWSVYGFAAYRDSVISFSGRLSFSCAASQIKLKIMTKSQEKQRELVGKFKL
jgi:hypothetical protein